MNKQTVNLTINKDPISFGSFEDKKPVDSFAYNIAKQIEMVFNVKVNYNVHYIGNSYNINCPNDPYMEVEISGFIESNF